ncbi:nuclear transport factor 2 family protein [Bradyrhizobium manausense]|uniref:YybH family protein n=1 Tax=Bradyrhizobium manausense TaxID=989370 RepID=UPI001BA654CF|nr:nuclear transport factor 2 family protein [Bradyrhizobium manausense]MBR0792151.1 nuclear transport factor 2 family protein [Bradyrhizobium manausense]
MRRTYVLCFVLAALSSPCLAADADLKQEVEKLGSAYADNFNKQNAAGIAALYATGGMMINAAGPHTNIAETYTGVFKAGFNHNEITVDQVSPLGPDTLVAVGEFHLTGKNAAGEPMDFKGLWTATDVREGGVWKIRALAAFPKAPPPKD